MADENEESYVEVSDNEEILSDVDEDDDENSFDSDLINDTNDDKKTTTLFNENDDSETVSSDELSDTDDEFSESEIDPQKLLDYNLLTVRAAENVVRLLPPLNVKKSEINLGLKIIEKVCKKFR